MLDRLRPGAGGRCACPWRPPGGHGAQRGCAGELAARHPDTVRTVALDITRDGPALAAVPLAGIAFGRLDVLVDKAGIGLTGAVGEATPTECRPVFKTNVSGLDRDHARHPAGAAPSQGRSRRQRFLRRRHLGYGRPWLLRRRQGHGAGSVRGAGAGAGAVRPSAARSPPPAGRSRPYAETSGRFRQYRNDNDGRPAGCPAGAVAVILQAIDADEPSLHLPLGPIAHAIAEKKLDGFAKDIAAWQAHFFAFA